MGKLKVLPEQAIIDGFKGKIDFYVHDGIPCFRTWPRSPGHRRSPAVEAQWPAFTEAARAWAKLPKEIQESYNRMARRSGLSGRDLQMRAYLKGLYRYPTEG